MCLLKSSKIWNCILELYLATWFPKGGFETFTLKNVKNGMGNKQQIKHNHFCLIFFFSLGGLFSHYIPNINIMDVLNLMQSMTKYFYITKYFFRPRFLGVTFETFFKKYFSYRVSQKTWEFSDEFDIVFSINSLI